ncbi:MAG: phage Gp37/Gp68 family protein [Desulfobacteraceae bacterium]|nr:phage Gp37/Gp68 family protein [Desulfobacteraceae bacterium]
MAEDTKIAWADNTWNPWQGCHKVSPGCANCYMFRDKKRHGQEPSVVIKSKAKTFNSPIKWNGPARVFVCSWSDFFIEEADAWRDDAWDIIRKTPHLTYLLLTKRPENIKDRLPSDWPLPNVWLGVTAENQEMADKRIPILCGIPAVKRFVSVEPMVGQVDFTIKKHWNNFINKIDWVIVGGESGPGARPAHPNWVRFLRDQCKASGTPFMFKQWGEWVGEFHPLWKADQDQSDQFVKIIPGEEGRAADYQGLYMGRVGTKNSGHLLDGEEHMEIPGEVKP